MKKIKQLLVLCSALIAVGIARASDFTIESAELDNHAFNNAQVSGSFGCQGQNISPSIHWSGVPKGTQSFLLTMFDIDAPTGSGFWHWVVADIPVSVDAIASGAGNDASKLPPGAINMKNDTGSTSYLGPCPPQGETHRYLISLTALKITKLPVERNATPAIVGFNAHYQAIGKATLTVQLAR